MRSPAAPPFTRAMPARRCGVCVLGFLFAAAALAQNPADQSCSATGSVVNSVTGAPVPRAWVTIGNSDGNVMAETDAGGRWNVPSVACGRASITAQRVGFLRDPSPAAPPAAQTLTAAASPLDLTLRLVPQAVLAGHVLDDQGDPVQGAMVSLLTSRVLNGLRSLSAAASFQTDDLGEYRFPGLAAGKYLICAAAPQNTAAPAAGARPFAEKCYPGPPDATPAITMDVPAGYEGSIDFNLTPLSVAQVRGVLSGVPEDTSTVVTMVSRALPGIAARMGMVYKASVRKDGTFVVTNVPPGAYTIMASLFLQNHRLMARAPVDVGASDVDGVRLHFDSGVTLTGTVKILSPSGKTYSRPQFQLSLHSPDLGVAQIVWDETRTSFTLPDVMPGSYQFTFSAPPPLYLKSAAMGGRDILNSDVQVSPGAGNFEIVVADDGGAVEGDVSAGSSDAVAAGAWVLLQRDGAPSRNVRAGPNGHFKIDTIPPGDYKIYAWDDNAGVEYANPEWMQRNATGVDVTVQAGQTQQVNLVRQTAPAQ